MTGHSHGLLGEISPKTKYYMMLCTLVVLTVADTVLITILLYYFTERYSQYINQATGSVYGIATIPVLIYRRLCSQAPQKDDAGDELTDALLPSASPPKKKAKLPPTWALVCIGILNGTGNFFCAIGIPHTRGVTQSLLMLTGIPLVMLLSFLVIGKKPSSTALFGALLIVAGATVSSLPSIIHPTDDGVQEVWYSVLIFLTAQVFYASEKVFEESMFGSYKLDVVTLFFWTIWVQVALGFAYYPLQSIKQFGGIILSDIPSIMYDGLLCTFGMVEHVQGPMTDDDGSQPSQVPCDWRRPFFFFTYCTVDYACYMFGLYVIQQGGANLMVLASAIALPLCGLAFAIPWLMGQFTETFHVTDLIALVLVLAGFSVYQFLSDEGRAAVQEKEEEEDSGAEERSEEQGRVAQHTYDDEYGTQTAQALAMSLTSAPALPVTALPATTPVPVVPTAPPLS